MAKTKGVRKLRSRDPRRLLRDRIKRMKRIIKQLDKMDRQRQAITREFNAK